MPNQILRLPEVTSRTGMPRSTLYAKIAEGQFPKPVKLSERSVGWCSNEIEAWVNERIATRGNDHEKC